MKYTWYILSILLLFLFTASTEIKTNDFEGIISFKKIDMYDTIFANYYIKGSKVRIDEFSIKGKIKKSKIINFETKEMYILKPSKKIYIKNYIQLNQIYKDNDLQITKTKRYKTINEETCYQWVIKNKEDNTVVSYWVVDKSYKYYGQLLNVLGETDKIPKYFQQFPGNEGFIPMVSEERSILRDKRMQVVVDKIIETPISKTVFLIPKGYKLQN